MTRPSEARGQNVFLNIPVGSYFFFISLRRSQLEPYEAMTRSGGSSRPRNYVNKISMANTSDDINNTQLEWVRRS